MIIENKTCKFFAHFITAIFESSTGAISRKYEVGITPAGWTFSIWGIIYTWEALWILYTLINLCRRVDNGRAYNSPILLPVAFFAVFMLNMGLNLTWIFVFDHEYIEVAFVTLFFISVTLYICMGISYKYLDDNKDVLTKTGRKKDIWLIRILVQNGLGIYATWTTIATLLNMAMVMIYRASPGVANEDACTVALALLGAELLTFVIADFFFLDRYSRYTVTPFVVVPFALGGSLSRNYTEGARNSIFTATLLAFALLFLVLKIMIMIWRHLRSNTVSANISESTEQITKKEPSHAV